MTTTVDNDTKTFYVGVNPPTGDYNDMENKPAIGGVELTSNTTLADLGLSDVFDYKGQKPTYNDLPHTGNKKGDVWNVADTGENYAWSGSEWDCLTGNAVVNYVNGQLESLGQPVSIDSSKNVISNLETTSLKSGVLQTTVRSSSSASDSCLASEKAIASIVETKQDTLVSGTNIKTIGGNSILGSGNIDVGGLPDQAGNAGKSLYTDGLDASWEVTRDPNTYRSLSTAQAIHLDDTLASEAGTTADGTYNGEAVTDGEIFTSADGSFKEFVDTILPPSVTWSNVGAYGVIGINEAGTMAALTSTDGLTVYTTTDGSTLTTLPSITREYTSDKIRNQSLTFGDNCLYLVENKYVNNYTTVPYVYRYDFTTEVWEHKNSSETFNSNAYSSFACGIINNTEILIIKCSQTIYSSTDSGVTWATMTNSPANYQPVRFTGGKFITSDGFKNLKYTTNATEWTSYYPTPANVRDCIWDGEKFVLVMTDRIATSPDITSGWTTITTTGLTLNADSIIGYNSGVYVLCTKVNNSTPFISTDLTNWTATSVISDITSQRLPNYPIAAWFANNKFRFAINNKLYEGVYTVQHEYSLTDLSYNKTSVDTALTGKQDTLTAGTGIDITSSTISATAMTGATGSVAGTAGMVPAPTVADTDKYLKGDGTWSEVQGGSSASYDIQSRTIIFS